MVFARVSADADQSTLAASLRAAAENRAMYGLSGAARLLSGVTLVAAAFYLLRTWIIRERLGTPLVPYLFVASGVITAVSGELALLLAATLPDASEPGVFVAVSRSTETLSDLRWITGKVGFTLMGLALIVAAPYQWKAGGPLSATSRSLRPSSASPCSSSGSMPLPLIHRISGSCRLLLARGQSAPCS